MADANERESALIDTQEPFQIHLHYTRMLSGARLDPRPELIPARWVEGAGVTCQRFGRHGANLETWNNR